jgi:hypothetical protein
VNEFVQIDVPKPCVHCGRVGGMRKPRGLCWKCYDSPEIRAKYPPTAPQSNPNRVVSPTPPLADNPTDAPPGSTEKVIVMEERVRNGRHIHHPGDALTSRKPKPNGRGCK